MNGRAGETVSGTVSLSPCALEAVLDPVFLELRGFSAGPGKNRGSQDRGSVPPVPSKTVLAEHRLVERRCPPPGPVRWAKVLDNSVDIESRVSKLEKEFKQRFVACDLSSILVVFAQWCDG
jgi:hypothetical protein